MTEKEKMLRGMLYAPARDETLLAELAACKTQCQQFNQRAYQAEGIESAQMLLRRLLGAAGEGLRIEPPFWCDYGWNISVGRNFYMNHGGVILDAGGVTFGDNVLVGPQCGFYTSGHPLDAAKRAQGLEFRQLDEKLFGNNVGWWFPDTEEGKELRDELNGVLQEMQDDGTIREIVTKWFYEDLTQLISNDWLTADR